jgi:hypothetical protein
MSFRKSVTHKAGKTWQENRNKDLYTGWHKNKDGIDWQVDHIVECQLGEYIWDQCLDGRRTTRGRCVTTQRRLIFECTLPLG